MGAKIILLSAVLLLGMLCPVCAGTYSMPLPSVIGEYLGCFPNACRKFADVSFGTEFQSIESVSIRWSGFIGQGLSNERSQPPAGEWLPHGGGFEAYVDSYLIQGGSGMNTAFQMNSLPCCGGPWTSLYDGAAHIQVRFYEVANSSNVLYHCNAELYSAELIVEGTPVSEPAAAMVLLAGVGGLGTRAIKERRQQRLCP